MEKRPRPFTAEKRFAKISSSTGAITNDDLLDAFNALSAYVKEVLSRASRLESSPSFSPTPRKSPGKRTKTKSNRIPEAPKKRRTIPMRI